MCGILGIISKNMDSYGGSVSASLDLLGHRGPDMKLAVLFSKNPPLDNPNIKSICAPTGHDIFLGHTRLSIIDLSDMGNQPMCNADGTVWIIYNGEVYNFIKLRASLESKYNFKSNTDTEVVLHAYEEYGESFVQKLEGMFAFVIFDINKKKVLAARDQIGIKPLYFCDTGGDLVLSSEIGPILSISRKPFDLNRDALHNYFRLGYVPTPDTLFAGISKIPPSELIVIDLAGDKPSLKSQTYWKPDINKERQCFDEEKTFEEFSKLLECSVRGCLISDVPLGIFLSGGMDSSAITYVASKISDSPLRTFSVGFDDPLYDESKYAQTVSRLCNTVHSHYSFGADFFEFLPSVVHSTEEPLADPASIPLWFLSREASRGVKVVLSGEGGDEIFGGYTRYFWDRFGKIYDNVPKTVRLALGKASDAIPESGDMSTTDVLRRVKKFFKSGELDHLERYLSWFNIFSGPETDDLLNPASGASEGDKRLLGIFRSYYSSLNGDCLCRLQFTDLRTMLLDNLLLKADKLSMDHSLEARVPLLSKTLVEFALNLPQDMKVRKGQTKYILRKFLHEKLPSEIYQRRKQGFEMPVGKWLKESGKAMTEKRILALSEKYGILDSAGLSDFLRKSENSRADYGRKLYLLLVLSLWFDKYRDFLKL